MAQKRKVLPLERITVGQLLRRTTEKYATNLAINRSGVAWTYQELDYYSDAVAAGLLAVGVKKGQHVAVITELEPESLLVFYAALKIGAIAAMICTSLPPEETERQIEDCDATMLIIGTSLVQDLAETVRKIAMPDRVEKIIYIGSRTDTGLPNLSWLMASGASVSAAQLQAAKDAVHPDDTAVILFTSGTTSKPKMVMVSHYSRVNGGIQQAYDLACTQHDRFMVTTPMFHCFCISANILAACSVGACLCIPETRHTGDILDMIERERCTIFSGVPTMFHAVLCNRSFKNYDISSLRTGLIGGSTYPVSLFKEIEKGFDFTLMSSLGQTETTAGLSVCEMDDDLELRATTVGHFMSHVEGCIKDVATGEILPTGEKGEICVRGYLVMQGYYKNPEQTAKTIDKDGWLHTGDMAYLDENGYIHLTGRLKDLIIRGGENIGPAEIENVLADLPGIGECKVIGVPDSHYGEEVCACISMRPDAEQPLTEEQVRERVAQSLADFKIPRYVLFFDEMPHTGTGKMDPNAIREMAETRLGLREK